MRHDLIRSRKWSSNIFAALVVLQRSINPTSGPCVRNLALCHPDIQLPLHERFRRKLQECAIGKTLLVGAPHCGALKLFIDPKNHCSIHNSKSIEVVHTAVKESEQRVDKKITPPGAVNRTLGSETAENVYRPNAGYGD